MRILEPVKAILVGTVIGGISSVLLSLTLEPEISEVRMGQYGGFIGLIASSTTTALLAITTRNNTQSNKETSPNKSDPNPDFSIVFGELIQRATENHLNCLQPGSPEYFEALELYGKVLSGENGTPNTNTPKTKTSHHAQGADNR
jgi:hypothetical protein